MAIAKISGAVSPIEEADKINELVDGVNAAVTSASVVASINTMLSALYPVGSIYIGTQSTCPLATLITGSTWELVSSGRVLQGTDNDHAAGTTIAAGVPNITGTLGGDVAAGFKGNTGAFGSGIGDSNVSIVSTPETINHHSFDASRSSSIYGNSNTVQPPAYVVNIWRRTA